MPGDGPALLRMPDMEFLGIIRIMCETIGNKTNNRKFDTQTRQVADSQSCNTKPDVDSTSRDKTY